MESKVILDGDQTAYALILDIGDECVGLLEAFADQHRLSAAQLTGIGIVHSTGNSGTATIRPSFCEYSAKFNIAAI